MAVFTACRNGPGAYFRAKFDDCNKAVSAGSVPFPGAGVGVGTEGGERSPDRGCEANGNAGGGVVKGLNDVAVDPLETVDVSPRRFPGAEVGGEFVRSRSERFEQVRAAGLLGDVIFGRHFGLLRVGKDAMVDLLTPKHGK